MQYSEHLGRFYIERALRNYDKAYEHIKVSIDLCPDLDLLPKLTALRDDLEFRMAPSVLRRTIGAAWSTAVLFSRSISWRLHKNKSNT